MTMSSPTELADQKPKTAFGIVRFSLVILSSIIWASFHRSDAAFPTISSSRISGNFPYNSHASKKGFQSINLDIFFDTDVRLAKKFLLRGVPTTLIIGKDGDEIARIVGSADFQDEDFKIWLQTFD